MPLWLMFQALAQRVQPKATYAAVLLLVRRDWQARLDAIQDRWYKYALDLHKPIPRILLLREVGYPWRLSTQVRRGAIMLWARIALL